MNIQLTLAATVEVIPSNKGGQKTLLDSYMYTNLLGRITCGGRVFIPPQRKSEDISGHGYTCFRSQDHQSGRKTVIELLRGVGYNIRWKDSP